MKQADSRLVTDAEPDVSARWLPPQEIQAKAQLLEALSAAGRRVGIGVTFPRWFMLTVVAATLAMCAIRNLPWHLDDFDQAKQAFVSFEMVEGGQWWFQHTPSGDAATKPPLAGWISAA